MDMVLDIYKIYVRKSLGSFALFMSCVCHAFTSVLCCLVVTCWKRADLLAFVCDV